MLRRAGAITVGVLCAYEVAALTSGRIPTVSRVCWWARRHPVGALGIWGAIGVLAWHLLVDGAEEPDRRSNIPLAPLCDKAAD